MLVPANTVYFIVSTQIIASSFSQAVMTNKLFSHISCCFINNFSLNALTKSSSQRYCFCCFRFHLASNPVSISAYNLHKNICLIFLSSCATAKTEFFKNTKALQFLVQHCILLLRIHFIQMSAMCLICSDLSQGAVSMALFKLSFKPWFGSLGSATGPRFSSSRH